ncbi:MAG: O-antigen ligase family protein [Rhodospirillales bacterium]
MTKDTGALSGIVIRQIAFIIMALAAAVRITQRQPIAPTLYVGGALAAFAFLIAISISAYTAGTSLLEGLSALVASGNYEAWTFGFLRHVFNAFSSQGAAADLEFVTSLKNNVATGLLISYICYRAGTSQFGGKPLARAVDIVVSSLFLVSIIMMLSRSVAFALIGVVIIVVVVDAVSRNNASIIVSILLAVAAGLVLFLALPDTVVSAITQRFENTGSYDSRIEVYEMAIPLIEKSFWVGYGIGAPLPDPTQAIHNLFLAAWFNSGILGFLTAAWFWLTAVAMVCLRILEVLLGRYKASYQLTLFHAWIAVIPIMGLFRCWLIGGGNLNFSAWFALGVFFGVLYHEAWGRKGVAETGHRNASLPALPG